MKQIFKLWYNTNPKKGSKFHKGYSISVEVDAVEAFYLNFHTPDHWYLQTSAPAHVTAELMDKIPQINGERDADYMVLADFKPKLYGQHIPRWTCLLDPAGSLPELIFVSWDDELSIQWLMCRELNRGGNRRNTHVWQDDYNALGISGVRKPQAAQVDGIVSNKFQAELGSQAAPYGRAPL
ncbi:hypothetical protein [Paramagnetospirillum magneticum]|uniref:hypothetical protein n=1 Tax=Paramagnetospirillum magneticum TaxID=84159 RepID=UPI0005C1FCBE|nr:hypothetical protein [Paramagnetospirillum magneticum]